VGSTINELTMYLDIAFNAETNSHILKNEGIILHMELSGDKYVQNITVSIYCSFSAFKTWEFDLVERVDYCRQTPTAFW